MVNQVREGCIISEDVFSLTNKPIIPKKTVITDQHINILKSFLIKTINIESTLINGASFHQGEKILEQNEQINESSTGAIYLKSVKEFKDIFKGWQSGLPIDISKIRKLIIPLLDAFSSKINETFTLHHYSTKTEYMYHHCVAVSLLSAFLGKMMGYSKAELTQLAIAGLLSDCGMAKVDPKVLSKTASLTLEEFNEVKQHSTHSFKMIKNVTAIKDDVKIAVLQHHERIDGSGYPLGLDSKQIHPYSKIIAVADVYHAMISERPYRSKQSPFKVLEQIIQDNFGKFDLQVIHALTTGITNFSIGTKVQLSNSCIGEIVFIDQKNPTRPMIKLIDSNEIIQLVNHRDIFIEEIL